MENIDFKSKNQLYEFFSNNQYKIGDNESVQPEMVFGKKIKSINNNINELYQVVFEEEESFQIWLLITSNEVRKKSWRTIIAKKVAESIGDYVLFMTKDYSKFYIQIIVDDMIEEIIFQPENLSVKADRFLNNLSNKQPLIDSMGLTASQLQAKHELTATKLADAILSKEGKKVELLFERAGLVNKKNTAIITSRPNAPLKEAEIIVSFSDKDTRNKQWINTNFGHTIGAYYQATGNHLKWLIILGLEGVTYLNSRGELLSFIEYPEEKEALILLLTSIIANIDIRAAFNGETFEQQFGSYSPFFAKATFLLKNYLDANKKDIGVVREEWERFFGKVYQAGDVDEELFIKHAYLSLLIKNVLFCKYLTDEVVSSSQSFIELTKYFEERGVELFFHDFYAWANKISELREDLFQALKGAIYESDDIFRVIYQDMVSPSTRSALGEFYTPPELALLMVDDVYNFGQTVLDPACGSGTFLIEIIKKIKESTEPQKAKLRAISQLHGFDINPIAVLVSKANILLQIEELYRRMLPVNIFLTDSLFPVKKRIDKDLNLGSIEVFILGEEIKRVHKGVEHITGSVGDLKINSQFFTKPTKKDPLNYIKEFGRILRFLDERMVHGKPGEDIVTNFDQQFTEIWLDNPIEGSYSSYSLRDNIHQIIRQLVALNSDKKNHIWLYLLYNELGTRIVNKNVDLVIGNPPWLVYRNVYNPNYQIQMRALAEKHRILPDQQLMPTLEMSALFLYVIPEYYLREGGELFFVVSNAFMAGDNHEYTRQFHVFENVEFWKFTKDLFNIHNVCLRALYNSTINKDKDDFEKGVKTVIFDIINKGNKMTIEVLNKDLNYIPYKVKETKKGYFSVKKLISPEEKSKLLQFGSNPYAEKVYQGATVVPRNLVFAKILEEEEDLTSITHFVLKSAKATWKFNPINELLKSGMIDKPNVNIESEYLYKLVRSSFIVPFIILRMDDVFLPIEPDHLKKSYKFMQNQKSLAWKHYQRLDELYQQKQESKKKKKILWKTLDHIGKLTAPRQYSKIKVVIPRSGTIVKAAVDIGGGRIIDSTCHFISLSNKEEAYYLCGMLNAPSLTESINIIQAEGAGGGGRDIYNRPFQFHFPKFDENNSLHLQISEKSKNLEREALNIFSDWLEKEKKEIGEKDVKIRKAQIQNIIYRNLGWNTRTGEVTGLLKELDSLVKSLINEKI